MKKTLSTLCGIALCICAFAQENVDVKELNAKLDAIQQQLSDIQANQHNYILGDIIPSTGEKKSSNVFWGINAGVFYDAGESVYEGSELVEIPASFSFTLKPKIGFYLSDRWVIGLKTEFAYNGNKDPDSSFIGNIASGFKQMSFRNVASNIAMGNGVGVNFLSWKVLPYARYRVTNLFGPRINLWVELELYAGQRYKKDSETAKYANPSTIYGATLSPMVSYDLNSSMMLCFTPDFIRWDGRNNIKGEKADRTSSFSAQLNPLYQALSSIVNISLIRKF